MNAQRLALMLFTAGVCGVVAAAQESAPPQVGSVKWRYDYNVARKEAQDKGLPLVIDFGTQNCFWCRKLDESTFKDAKVIGVMNERFIPLKIDAEREPSLTSQLRITSYPTIVMASADGKILGTMEGFQDAVKFHENLQRALASVTNPEWMTRDLQVASKLVQDGEYARAITALKNIVEDGKGRPVQTNAQRLLNEMEQQAGERLTKAAELQAKGLFTEAVESLTETQRLYAGLKSAKDAAEMASRIAQSPELRNKQRSKRAAELIVQARDFYKHKEYIPCLDRCEVLVGLYGDMPEGMEASQLVGEIKNNPEWLQNAADTMSDRLGGVYLALADSLLKKGQPQRAEFYLNRVIQAFPGSRQAESAQIRLGQLQGTPPRKADVQSARP